VLLSPAASRHSAIALVPASVFALLDPIRDPRWTRLLARARDACAFHHPAWLQLLEDVYRYPILACCVLSPEGELVAGLPLALVGGRFTRRRLVGLPFSDICRPLSADGTPSQLNLLGIGLDELRRRMGLDLEVHAELPDAPSGHPAESFYTHVLDLEDGFDPVIGRMKPQVRRGARRAEREGLTVELRRDRAALADFYGLHLQTRRRQGVLTQPRRFILGLDRMFERDLGFVLLVRDGPAPAAAAVFLRHGDGLIYKYGASSADSLPKRPNNLLFTEAIRWACENGVTTLDFGRTDIGHDNLRSFKRSFGAEEQVVSYTRLSDTPTPGKRPGMAAAARVIRHSPPVVGRVAGELLYRDFGP
jgi:CelD/BcsL family acetyltransferase involved in cellulose biosynthesis